METKKKVLSLDANGNMIGKPSGNFRKDENNNLNIFLKFQKIRGEKLLPALVSRSYSCRYK